MEPRLPVYNYESVVCNGQALPLCGPQEDLGTYAGALFWSKNLP